MDLVEDINELHSAISTQDWGKASQASFLNAIKESIDALKELNGKFEKIDKELKSGNMVGGPELDELEAEFGNVLPVLKANFKLEKEKKSIAKESNVFEKSENPELYRDLAQRIQALLLRARYNAERINVFALKESTQPIEGKNAARQMLNLLHAKEEEIGELREKYENVRKKSYLGFVQEETSADLEQEMGKMSVKMGDGVAGLRKEISLHEKQIEYIENSYAQLKERLGIVEEGFGNYAEKSLELISMLKKERDYSRKVVLDIEHETMKARGAYTNELLSMQENKIKARSEAEAGFRKELDSLKKDLIKKEDLLDHFRNVAEDKAAKERELGEKVKRLSLLLKVKERHEAVKNNFKKSALKVTAKKKKKK